MSETPNSSFQVKIRIDKKEARATATIIAPDEASQAAIDEKKEFVRAELMKKLAGLPLEILVQRASEVPSTPVQASVPPEPKHLSNYELGEKLREVFMKDMKPDQVVVVHDGSRAAPAPRRKLQSKEIGARALRPQEIPERVLRELAREYPEGVLAASDEQVRDGGIRVRGEDGSLKFLPLGEEVESLSERPALEVLRDLIIQHALPAALLNSFQLLAEYYVGWPKAYRFTDRSVSSLWQRENWARHAMAPFQLSNALSIPEVGVAALRFLQELSDHPFDASNIKGFSIEIRPEGQSWRMVVSW